ncbi:CHAT domain-containing protein [Lactifluus volemus]|nr:CHAT domain-containing protein [Lactifluus volemus]
MSWLVLALADSESAESMSDIVVENIKEMTILCRELLNSDSSTSPPILPFQALTNIINGGYGITGELQDQAIECLREANTCFPSSPQLSFMLGECLARRFSNAFSIVDCEEAMAILDRVMTSSSDLPEDVRSDIQQKSLAAIADSSYTRYYMSGKPEYLEEAISHIRTYLSSIPLDHPRRPRFSQKLTDLTESRVRGYAIQLGSHKRPNTFDFSTLSSLTASLTKPNSSSMSHKQWGRHNQALCAIALTAQISVDEDAIKYCRLLVASLRHGPSSSPGHDLAHLAFITLGTVLHRAFLSTNKVEYLDESIATLRDGLKMPRPACHQQSLTSVLASSLSARLLHLRRKSDLDEVMRLYTTMVNDPDTCWRESTQLLLCYGWADTAHSFGHPSVMTAYERALSLMEDSLYHAPTLETQHFRLVSIDDKCRKLPSDYASFLAFTLQLEKAIETLERGRALLWSEMRGFRTSADQLATVDLPLAKEFVAINSKLERVTTSMVPYEVTETQVTYPESIDPFSHLVVTEQRLLEERDELISRIRALPDFGSFLKPPSFDALRSAALRGPVIMINHCRRGSDILILLHDLPPSLITTTGDFYNRAIELSDRLVKTRKGHCLESKQYQRTLRSVLGSLYELVGKPVIEEFRKLKIPEQSRVWWCPVSVFCHLPLHAMGPIPSDDGVKRYFSDLYISSYTPTLSALIESHKPGGQSSGMPSIVLVAQPGSLLHANPEICSIQQLNTTVTSLISKDAMPSSVVEGLKHHRFSHFVCHGNLEPGKPFDASFQLYGGERLTLLDIVRSRLPTAEFAFLSACHTAELTEDSIDDEVLHLTAAMQYCGFRSVVGTMWAVVDESGQHLVEDFYKAILSSDEPGVPYHERSARALRDAVKNLRKGGASLERWVNYVHYGA